MEHVSDKTGQINRQTKKIDDLMDQNKKQKEQLEQKETSNKDLIDELKSLDKEHKLLEGVLEDMKETAKMTSKQVSEYQEHIESLQGEMGNMYSESKLKVILESELNTQSKNFRILEKDFKDDFKVLEKENNVLKSHGNHKQKINYQERLKEQFNETQEKLAASEKENKLLRSKMNKSDKMFKGQIEGVMKQIFSIPQIASAVGKEEDEEGSWKSALDYIQDFMEQHLPMKENRHHQTQKPFTRSSSRKF